MKGAHVIKSAMSGAKGDGDKNTANKTILHKESKRRPKNHKKHREGERTDLMGPSLMAALYFTFLLLLPSCGWSEEEPLRAL